MKPRLYTHEGRSLTLKDWAAEAGCSVHMLYGRVVVAGWPMGIALTAPKGFIYHRDTHGARAIVKRYTHDGKTLTATEWSALTGISRAIIYHRIHRLHWSIDLALTRPKNFKYPKPPAHHAKRYTFNGRTLPLSEWAKETGVSYNTLRERIKQSRWPLERALTTPIRSNEERGLYRRNQRLIHEMIEAFRSDLATITDAQTTEYPRQPHQPHQTGGYQPTSRGDLLTGVGSGKTQFDLQLIARGQS